MGESVNWDSTENVFIEGDNLEVLKILQNHYFGKIKLIYIDPPYNTGKDFVYSDDFSDPIGHYLNLTGQSDEGGRLSTNTEASGRFHSNWLNMMYPRLKLARNLLAEDGVIFISIDDNEQGHLRTLSDEIFGEANFIGTLVHQRAKGGGKAKFYVKGHDMVHVYARNITAAPPLVRDKVTQGKTVIFNGRECVRNDDVLRKVFGKYETGTERRCFYEDIIFYHGEKKKEEIDEKLASGKLVLEKNQTGEKHVIVRYEPIDSSTSKLYSIIKALSELGKSELETLGLDDYFTYPKPTQLLTVLCKALTQENDIILDFFAGSATTAHAVMQLNAEDGGNRKFIMVQLPEQLDEKTGKAALEAGYTNIAQISRERIRRAGAKIREDFALQLEARDTPLDTGFRAFRLTDTNFVKWQLQSNTHPEELGNLMDQLADTARDDATPADLLMEVLLKAGFPLTSEIQAAWVLVVVATLTLEGVGCCGVGVSR